MTVPREGLIGLPFLIPPLTGPTLRNRGVSFNLEFSAPNPSGGVHQSTLHSRAWKNKIVSENQERAIQTNAFTYHTHYAMWLACVYYLVWTLMAGAK